MAITRISHRPQPAYMRASSSTGKVTLSYMFVVSFTGCHKPAVVHRDINSRNILVNPDGTCVVGDFGFAMKVCGSSVVGEGDGDNSTITDVSLLSNRS